MLASAAVYGQQIDSILIVHIIVTYHGQTCYGSTTVPFELNIVIITSKKSIFKLITGPLNLPHAKRIPSNVNKNCNKVFTNLVNVYALKLCFNSFETKNRRESIKVSFFIYTLYSISSRTTLNNFDKKSKSRRSRHCQKE